jgi:hypothetical protein
MPVDVLLLVHLLWAIWMIAGVVLAVAGFRWPRFWRWRAFRITHLIGLIGTATVPLWAEGICPLTTWEWKLRSGGPDATAPESFLARLIESILYVDVDARILSAITALGAVVTIVIFVWHPPRRS